MALDLELFKKRTVAHIQHSINSSRYHLNAIHGSHEDVEVYKRLSEWIDELEDAISNVPEPVVRRVNK